MEVWFPVIEANQGFWSLLALVAALSLAWIEYRRAERAEAARILEPAGAALKILDLLIEKTKIGLTSEGAAREAVKYANRCSEPFVQIARGPTQPPDLILALHDAAAAIETFETTSQIAFEDEATRRQALERRVALLEAPRTQIASIYKLFGGIIG